MIVAFHTAVGTIVLLAGAWNLLATNPHYAPPAQRGIIFETQPAGRIVHGRTR